MNTACRPDPVALILGLAYARGYAGLTFATAEELATPGYDAAYTAGVQDKQRPAALRAQAEDIAREIPNATL